MVTLQFFKYLEFNFVNFSEREKINGGCLSDCLEKYKRKYYITFFPEEIVQYLMK